MKIVLSTHNEHKCAEMSALLSTFSIEILSLEDFPEIGEIIAGDGKCTRKYENGTI